MTNKPHRSLVQSTVSVRSILFGLILLVSTGLTACGIKKDPVPIAEPTALPITNLAHFVEDGNVTLTWTIAQDERFRSHVAGFLIHRSKEDAKTEKCQGCPILFSPVADMPVDIRAQSGPDEDVFTFSEPVEKGFRYIYKGTVYLKSGTISSDSNLVEFTY